MKATYHKYILEFKRPSGTSRGVLKTKETWFLVITDGERKGIGECGILRGLSYDDRPGYEQMLEWTCDHITDGPEALWEALREFPSIQFGVEMAFRSLQSADPYHLFPSAFTEGKIELPINGLIWMGDQDFMKDQIDEKIALGFDCIKMKIGAINIEKELSLLRFIRSHFSKEVMTLRVDANGAFTSVSAPAILQELADLDIHSIEQPIKVGQPTAMKALCERTPIPIALDEELIGVIDLEKKRFLLETVRPQFIILKPSFVGGFKGSEEWISLAETLGIGWWITSALESNIGLNAIAQWTYTLKAKGHQGLGTGSLFTNNIEAPLEVRQGHLLYNPHKEWDFKEY
jgi:o-succinylbenzoate synthase